MNVHSKIDASLVLVLDETTAQECRAQGIRSVRNASAPEMLLDSEGRLLPEIDFWSQFVILIPPGGEHLRDTIAVNIGDERCLWSYLPDEPQNIQAAVAGARRMWLDEIARLDDIPDPGPVELFETGFDGLDRHGLRITTPAFMPIVGPYGPLPGYAQFHTPSGWKRLDEWTETDLALVYDFETGATKYEQAGRVVADAPDGFLRLRNGGTTEIVACDKHRWPVVGKLGAKKVLTTADLAEAGQSEHGSGYSLIRTFDPPPLSDMPLTDDEIRLQVAVCADGSIREKMVNNRICVCVRKERKKERLARLLDALNRPYRVRQYSQRPTETHFDFDGNEDKRLSQFRNASPRQLAVVFDELQHWDGHIYDDSRLVLSTSDPADAEFCEYLFSACGKRASVFVQNGNPETQRDNYLVCANAKGALTRANWSAVDRVPSDDGKKYCLTTSTGFFVCRLSPGQVFVTGNSGKSVFLRQLLINLWHLHGWRFLITSFEERVKPRFQRDLRRHLIGSVEATWTQDDIAKADAEINRACVFFRRKRNTALDADRLIDRIEYAVRTYGIRVVAIDPFNEIDHVVPRGMSKTDYVGAFIMRLKQLADDYNLLMICALHPPKDGVEKRLQKNGLLTLNDGADSANWGNKADIGLCMWRNIDGPTFLHVDKVKDHETMGRPVLCEMIHDPAFNRFRVGRMGHDILFGDDAE